MEMSLTLPDGFRIILRPPAESDIPCVYEAAISSREKLAPWMGWCHADYTLQDTEKWLLNTIASDTEHTFLMLDDTKQLCLGTCGINDINMRHRFANLGYWVRARHVGRGIAPAATLAVAKFAFSELELIRIDIVAGLGNYASQRVARKVGATREGILRNGLLVGDILMDAVMYSLIPADISAGRDQKASISPEGPTRQAGPTPEQPIFKTD